MFPANTIKASKPFRFLDLPAELRNIIYNLLLEGRCSVDIDWFRPGWQWKPLLISAGIFANIMFACRTIYLEARTILYGYNTSIKWSLRDQPKLLTPFLTKIGDSIQHLRRIDIGGTQFKKDLKPIFTKLKQAKILTELILSSKYIDYACNSRHRYTPEQFAKELGPFFRSLHKAQKFAIDQRPKRVVEILRFNVDHLHLRFDSEIHGMKRNLKDCSEQFRRRHVESKDKAAERDREAEEFTEKVRAELETTFK